MSDWQQLVDRARKEGVGSNWTYMEKKQVVKQSVIGNDYTITYGNVHKHRFEAEYIIHPFLAQYELISICRECGERR